MRIDSIIDNYKGSHHLVHLLPTEDNDRHVLRQLMSYSTSSPLILQKARMSEGKPGTEARTYRVRPGAKTIMEPGKAIHPHSDPPSAPVRRPWRRAKLILAKNAVAVDIVPLMTDALEFVFSLGPGK
jgi:hypothetical protein